MNERIRSNATRREEERDRNKKNAMKKSTQSGRERTVWVESADRISFYYKTGRKELLLYSLLCLFLCCQLGTPTLLLLFWGSAYILGRRALNPFVFYHSIHSPRVEVYPAGALVFILASFSSSRQSGSLYEPEPQATASTSNSESDTPTASPPPPLPPRVACSRAMGTARRLALRLAMYRGVSGVFVLSGWDVCRLATSCCC